ncbi:hypothetical protein [Gemmatimonas sp.]|uniref:hypothetical protein n=1 Tax=Gemmatimonas sp. TaxID=1962908 RepID=UPI003340A587
MKRFLIVFVAVCGIAMLYPSISSVIDGDRNVVFAQDIGTDDGDMGGCEQTCTPMPASCDGGHRVCAALPGCTVCICTLRDPVTKKCTTVTSTINTPHQQN